MSIPGCGSPDSVSLLISHWDAKLGIDAGEGGDHLGREVSPRLRQDHRAVTLWNGAALSRSSSSFI